MSRATAMMHCAPAHRIHCSCCLPKLDHHMITTNHIML
jgi:hypothetical protein